MTAAFYVAPNGDLIPFAGGGSEPPPPPPPPVTSAKQLIGWAANTSGVAWQGTAVSQASEDLRLADLFDWPLNGPPVARLYRQQQNPPFSDMQRTLTDGRIPWISCKPGSGGLAGDKAGGSDARWAAWGNYMKDFWPKTIIFTYDHEVDRHAYSGSATYTNIQYRNYQADFVDTFRHIMDIMIGTDPTHSLDHVIFASNLTGWAYRKASNRDPGLCWHPDFHMVSVDPYDFYLFNDGRVEADGRRELWENYNGWSTGALEHYIWCTNPLKWYADLHPTWAVPSVVTSNLDKFPVRMAIGETGFQPEMRPNSTNTLWVPYEDVNSTTNSISSQLRQMFVDMRNAYKRYEVVVYWHSSTQAIGNTEGSPNYFAGPAEHRWGCYWPGAVEVFRQEASKVNHIGAITPWTPGGLAT